MMRKNDLKEIKFIKVFTLSLMIVLLAGPSLSPSSLVAGPLLPTNVSPNRFAAEVAWMEFSKLPSKSRPRVVVVLGGGGARGLSHIGVLRVLEEEGIPIDEIVGVSVGALIGALYSSGFSVDNIESMAGEIGWQRLTDFSRTSMMKLILREELLSSSGMETYLNQHIGNKVFSDLNIPFTCIATDIRTGERVIFREGNVALAARASATIPAVFQPVEYRHRYLVDGGLVDNLPTDIAHEPGRNDIVIGVLPIGDFEYFESPTVFKSLVRAIDIQKDIIIESKKKSADFMIEPDVGNVSIVDLNRSKECIEAGTLAARKSALEIKALILSRVIENKKRAIR